MRLDSSGNLLVGTTASNYRLNVQGGGIVSDSSVYAQFTTLDTGTTATDGLLIGLGIGSSPIAYIAQNENAALAFLVNGSERMRIDSSGILLINKASISTSNSAKLSVAGQIQQPTGTGNTDGTSDAKNYGYGWTASASESTMSGLLTANYQGNYGMDLYLWLRGSSGGTMNNRFQVSNAGSCYNSTGTYGTISDINIKENVTPAPNYLDRLLQVEIVKYSLKEEHSSFPTKLGVVAQQVEGIFPNLIEETNSNDEDGNLVPTKAVKYSVFVPMLIKAMQELSTQLTELKAEVATLRGTQS
jgi:hypothetical protein